MLPKAVQEQADRAEALQQALMANTAPAAPVTPAVPVEPQPAQATQPVAAVVEVQPVATPDSWELKYRVLEGKYRAEVPRLTGQLREANDKIRLLEAAASAAPQAVQADVLTPDSVRDRYGDDFASAVESVVESRVKSVRDELSTEVNSVKEGNAQRARQDFFRDLSTYVPNYAAVDQEAGFTAYLDEFDVMTGRTRREFFVEADQGNDAARVAGFFRGYLGSKVVPPPTPTPTPGPSVEDLISPDSSRSSEAPAGKKMWTQPEVRAFYSAARRGVYTPTQYAAIDADITAAAGEGRMLA